jgi:hypothetical protein
MRFGELFAMTLSPSDGELWGSGIPSGSGPLVTRRAMKRVAGFSLAHAFRKRFELADRARIAFAPAYQHQIVHVFPKVISGLVVVQSFAALFDGRISLEMALPTDGVTLRRGWRRGRT